MKLHIIKRIYAPSGNWLLTSNYFYSVTGYMLASFTARVCVVRMLCMCVCMSACKATAAGWLNSSYRRIMDILRSMWPIVTFKITTANGLCRSQTLIAMSSPGAALKSLRYIVA